MKESLKEVVKKEYTEAKSDSIKSSKQLKEWLKEFWDFVWNSDSLLSYLVFLILVFIFVKFLFLPGLGLIMQTSLPLAIVESSSMEHYSLKYCTASNSNGACIGYSETYQICDKQFDSQKFFKKEEYWTACGDWYSQNANLTKEQFREFSFKNGFRKGDLMIIIGKKNIKVGDVIVFNAGRNHPIIHRVIVASSKLETKGDHNSDQLSIEKSISEEQIIGVAVARIPYIGWVKLFVVELLQKIIR